LADFSDIFLILHSAEPILQPARRRGSSVSGGNGRGGCRIDARAAGAVREGTCAIIRDVYRYWLVPRPEAP